MRHIEQTAGTPSAVYIQPTAATSAKNKRKQGQDQAPQQVLPISSLGSNEGTNYAMPNSICLEASMGDKPTPINSVQFSLGHNVSEILRLKIIEGKYVDLVLLLKNSNIEDATSETVFVVGSDGQMVCKQKSAIRINSIEKWTDAFLIFISTFTSVHASKFQDMLKYMHNVRTGADMSLGWKSYDEQFRLKVALDPSKSWALVDTELWVMYIVGGQHSSLVSGGNNGNKCYSFNFQGFCFKKQCVMNIVVLNVVKATA